MYLPNSHIPNANHNGARVGHHRLTLDIIDSRWALLAHVGGCVGSARVFEYCDNRPPKCMLRGR